MFKTNNKNMKLIIFFIFIVISGCGISESKFDQIQIGDRRESVIETLGNPDSVSSIEAPLFSGQHLVWRERMNRKTYTVTIAMGRVVAKTVE